MKLFKNDYYANMDLADIRAKVAAGERLSFEDGVRLFNCPEPLAVGALAHQVRTRLHGDKAFYVLNRHVNYTNVCVNGCVFCAYQREEGQQGGFVLTVDDVLSKIDAAPVTPREVHIVGGCHPKLSLAYFEDVLNAVKTRLPGVVLKCFTAVEIAHFARLENLSAREVLSRLQKAGLDMLPGAGPRYSRRKSASSSARASPRRTNGWPSTRRHMSSASRPTAPCSSATSKPSRTGWTTWCGCASPRTGAAATPASSPCPS